MFYLQEDDSNQEPDDSEVSKKPVMANETRYGEWHDNAAHDKFINWAAPNYLPSNYSPSKELRL